MDFLGICDCMAPHDCGAEGEVPKADIWTPPALQGRLRFWIQDRTADDIFGLWLPPSRRALMTIRSQEPHDTAGVGATGPLFRFILRRSDLFPSDCTH